MNPIFSTASYQMLARGDYQSLVQSAVDQAKGPVALDDMPWIIGALSFLGRSAEAEGLYNQHVRQLSPLARGAARFYLAVSLCRQGQFEASRRIFAEALLESRSLDDPFQKFYALQGLAYYRYSTGRLDRARVSAEAALRYASAVFFVYGTILSQELLGHIQLSMGHFHSGFRYFERARERALGLGQGALLQAIDISDVLYRASFGIAKNSDELVKLLEASIGDEFFEDSYTQTALNLELARVHILRGDLVRGKEQLENSSALVYGMDNPDLEMDYNLQLAALLRCRGEWHQALSIVRATKFRVDGGRDLRAKLKVLGFELQLLKALGRLPEHEAGLAELNRLSRLSGSLMARRYLKRQRIEVLEDVRQGEDSLGDLIDHVVRFKKSAVPEILRMGWYGLLPLALNIPPSDKVLYFDVEPGSFTLFDQGDVQHLKDGCSALIRKLIHILGEAPSSKENLATRLWQQSYNPLRHDGLIYALVAKARKVLGRSAAWIEAYEHGYRLRAGVRVVTAFDAPEINGEPDDKGLNPIEDELLPRQRIILDLMREGNGIEPREIIRRLAVSDATVSRDMALLIDKGFAKRVGRGRATRYVPKDAKLLGDER